MPEAITILSKRHKDCNPIFYYLASFSGGLSVCVECRVWVLCLHVVFIYIIYIHTHCIICCMCVTMCEPNKNCRFACTDIKD